MSATRWRLAWLLERLALVAALGALAATLCASTGALRERAARSTCISHLRSIGRAIAMYSEDYGGLDDPKAPSDMALPPSLVPLMLEAQPAGLRSGAGGIDTFHCADAPITSSQGGGLRCDYLYQRWPASLHHGSLPPYPVALARRGMAFPIVVDLFHDARAPHLGSARDTQFVIVLRLDGRVSARDVPYPGYSWTW